MGTAALEHLNQALDELNTLDLDHTPDAELTELAVGLARCRCRLLAATTHAVSVWDQRGAYRSDGSKAAWARLSREGNLSANEARTIVRRAKALRSMPGAHEALSNGDISASHIDLLATTISNDVRAAAYAGDEPWLLDQCRTMRYTEVKQVVQYWCQRVDPDGCERAGRDLLDDTTMTAVETLDGCVHVRGMLDPVGGAIFREALRRIEHDLYEHDQRTKTKRSDTARRAAALVEMAIRASTSTGGRRPEPLVNLVAGVDTMSRLCELSTGIVVDPTLVVPYLTSSHVQAFVFDDAKHVLGISPQRTFRGWLRRAIQVRDRHCTHPAGCDIPWSECDVDHIIPHSQGGPTSQDNGRLRCHAHNRDHTLRNRTPHNDDPP